MQGKIAVAEIRGSFGSFKAAGDYFRQKVNLPTKRWDDLHQGQHARAFVIAGATRDALLVDMRKAVDAAISKGETLEDFRKRFRDIVSKHGWHGWTGEGSEAGENWRTAVIYHTNLRTAYMAGRWETLKEFPYLQYQHNSTKNPREEHQAWDGKIIARDDPWWQTHYPPNGWGCRCSVTGVSEARLRALGKTAPDTPPPAVPGDPPDEWAYHVGEASSGRKVDERLLAAERGGKMSALGSGGPEDFGRPVQVPFDATNIAPLPRMTEPDDLRQSFRSVIGGERAAFTDPTGAVIEITDAIIEHWLEDPKRIQGREQYLPFLRDVVENPYEVWAGFARNELTGKVYLRRRYIKGFTVGKERIVGVIADAVGGQWVSFNMFSGNQSGAKNQRVGMLLWGRP